MSDPYLLAKKRYDIMSEKKLKIISLGGSTLFNGDFAFNDVFILKFKSVLRSLKGMKFIIVVGGGKTSRFYVDELKKLDRKYDLSLTEKDYDFIGIAATHINALFLSKVFDGLVFDTVDEFDEKLVKRFMASDKPILFVYGKKPGRTSDYDATEFAVRMKQKQILNITNIDYVYDRDPTKYKNAQPIKELSWNAYFKIIGHRTESSGHYPFDPKASELCRKNHIKVDLVLFRKTDIIKRILEEKNALTKEFSTIR